MDCKIIIFTVLLWDNIRITGWLQGRESWPKWSILQFLKSSLRYPEPDPLKKKKKSNCKSHLQMCQVTHNYKKKLNILHRAFKKDITSIYSLKTDISKFFSIRHYVADTFISESCNLLNHNNLCLFPSTTMCSNFNKKCTV